MLIENVHFCTVSKMQEIRVRRPAGGSILENVISYKECQLKMYHFGQASRMQEISVRRAAGGPILKTATIIKNVI
jgi:hypothetical protein